MTASEVVRCVERTKARYDEQRAMFPNAQTTWETYWSTNRRHVFKSAEKFKRMLSADAFQLWLSDHHLNAWSLVQRQAVTP